jgi:hypothetical protein
VPTLPPFPPLPTIAAVDDDDDDDDESNAGFATVTPVGAELIAALAIGIESGLLFMTLIRH